MTIDSKLHIIDLADNGIFKLNTRSVTAAIAEFDNCEPASGRLKALRALASVVKQLEPELTRYLAIRDSTPSPPSATVLHKKLWQALKLRGFSLPVAERYEVARPSTAGVIFYGASEIPHYSIETALELYDGHKVAFVLAESTFDILGFLNDWKAREWLPHHYPQNAPLEVVDVAVEQDVLVAFTVGMFDDPVSLVFTGGGELARIVAILQAHLRNP